MNSLLWNHADYDAWSTSPSPAHSSSTPSYMERCNTAWKMLESDKKARILLKIWEEMEPCVKRCILARLDVRGPMLLQNYQVIHEECHNIVMKNLRKFESVPPCAFSEAVHSYLMRDFKLYNNKTWRVISAFFEYTCMEITAELALAGGKAAAGTSQSESPAANGSGYGLWGWSKTASPSSPGWNDDGQHGNAYPMDPKQAVMQVHGKVHETHENTEDILKKLEKVLQLLEQKR